MSKREKDSVRDYFHRTSLGFDSLYSSNRSMILRAIDKRFRSDIYDRFDLAFRECEDIEGSSVLDVGCGSGRYAIEFARRGASRIVGIDFAQSMIDLAVSLTEDVDAQSKVEFICGDFMELEWNERFDYSLAVGILDYVAEPKAILDKMLSMTLRKIIISFPKYSFLRSTQRKIRYKLMRCPVYFYELEDVERLLTSLGMTDFRIVELQGDYFVSVTMTR